MGLAIDQIRRVEIVEHPALISFNREFGTESDISRYENVRSDQRVTSPIAAYLNELQMDAYIPTRVALLLKNNLHDEPFITHTTRSVLYQLRQSGKIGDYCFNFLHAKLNAGDYLSVFRYLYILDLYSNIARVHDITVPDPAFRFESPALYSDKLVKSPLHVVAKEELQLQSQSRKQFMKKWLVDLAARANCPREAQALVPRISAVIDPLDPAQFRTLFLDLFDKLQNTSELEKICWEELKACLIPFNESNFFEQAYLKLKTESYYRQCLSRVTTLRESLERTNAPDLVTQSEKCKKAYKGCVYLLGDAKNMPACSPMRFAAIIGKMRTEWQYINNAFGRASQQHAHHLCSCHIQTPASQNQLAEWPFAPHPLIPLNPAQPVRLQQNQEENARKTIAVIGCKWGGGHMEIGRGISNNLATLGYHPITVDLPKILISQDPINSNFITQMLGQDWSIASLYMGLMKHKAFAIIDFLRWISTKFFSFGGYSEVELKLIMEHLLKINTDAVVVDYSAHNEALIKACEMLGIPIMHVATDINNTIETRDKPPTYAHFKMALPFNVQEVVTPVAKTTTAEQRIFIGPPVKQEFTQRRTHEDILLLKQRWGIDTTKKVVIVANGLAGGSSSYPDILAKKYANTPLEQIPIHLVVLCGKDNTSFKRYLDQYKTNLPMTNLLYTDQMEELMAMASEGGVLIGKAGASTIFESLARGTRTLIDTVAPGFFDQGVKHFFITCLEMIMRIFGFNGQFYWEKDNADFAIRYGFADTFNDQTEFLAKLENLLNNDNRPVPLNGVELMSVQNELPRQLREMLLRAQADPAIARTRLVHQNL